MKKGLVLLLGMFFASATQASGTLTEVHLQSDVGAPACAFDTQISEPKRLSPWTVGSRFSVRCDKKQSFYKFETTLASIAQLSDKNGQPAYGVHLFVRPGGPACHGNNVHQDAFELNSTVDALGLNRDLSPLEWHYCIQLQPMSGQAMVESSSWPLAGAIPITLSSPEHQVGLPAGAHHFQVHFPHNSAVLDAAGKRMIEGMFLLAGPAKDYIFQLHGHASLVGPSALNRDLSARRLEAVKTHLMSIYQVQQADLWGQPWGDSRPAALKTEYPEDPKNRRVDVVFIPKQTAVQF